MSAPSAPPAPTPVALVEDLYVAFAAGDLDAILEHCHADVVLTQDPALPWGGRHEGADGVATFALTLVGTIESTVVPEVIYAADDKVIQYGRTRGTVRATGAAFDLPECHVFTMRDGRVAQVAFHIDSAAMLEVLAA